VCVCVKLNNGCPRKLLVNHWPTVGQQSVDSWPRNNQQASVVQTVDGAVHRINRYPLDIAIGFAITYPVDGDLSGGWRYPSFGQLGPGGQQMTSSWPTNDWQLANKPVLKMSVCVKLIIKYWWWCYDKVNHGKKIN